MAAGTGHCVGARQALVDVKVTSKLNLRRAFGTGQGVVGRNLELELVATQGQLRQWGHSLPFRGNRGAITATATTGEPPAAPQAGNRHDPHHISRDASHMFILSRENILYLS